MKLRYAVLFSAMVSDLSRGPVVAFADKDPTLSSRSSIAALALTISSGQGDVILKTASHAGRDHDCPGGNLVSVHAYQTNGGSQRSG